MKKVSTGERIKNMADFRRRSVGGPRGDADSDVTTEQLWVSELMDTTPSSSYEGESLQGGYVLNTHDASVCDSPHERYDSDGEAANEVVTAMKEVVGKADLIVKEDVPEVRQHNRFSSKVAYFIVIEDNLTITCRKHFPLEVVVGRAHVWMYLARFRAFWSDLWC